MFAKRIGPDPHANGAKSVGGDGCPDIWELDNGDFAVIGIDITDVAIAKLPPTAGCGGMSGSSACRAICWSTPSGTFPTRRFDLC